MGDGAAAALPERGLMQFFGDACGFDGTFTQRQWPQDAEGTFAHFQRGVDGTETGDTLIGDNLHQRVQIFRLLESLIPTAVHGGPGERQQAYIGDLHRVGLSLPLLKFFVALGDPGALQKSAGVSPARVTIWRC